MIDQLQYAALLCMAGGILFGLVAGKVMDWIAGALLFAAFVLWVALAFVGSDADCEEFEEWKCEQGGY